MTLQQLIDLSDDDISIQYLNKFLPNPEAFNIDTLLNDTSIPAGLLFLLIEYETLTVDQKDRINNQLGNINSAYISHSSQINNSKFIYNSCNILNSERVANSSDIQSCKFIADCSNVSTSQSVYKSSFVYDSTDVIDSQTVSNSTNILSSNYILNSHNIMLCTNLTNCEFVRMSNSLVDSIFCTDCKNCNNCLFCSELTDANYMLFNKPIAPIHYESIIKMFHKIIINYTKLISDENLNNCIIEVPLLKFDLQLIYKNLPNQFYKWIKTLPNYSPALMYQITYNNKFLDELYN